MANDLTVPSTQMTTSNEALQQIKMLVCSRGECGVCGKHGWIINEEFRNVDGEDRKQYRAMCCFCSISSRWCDHLVETVNWVMSASSNTEELQNAIPVVCQERYIQSKREAEAEAETKAETHNYGYSPDTVTDREIDCACGKAATTTGAMGTQRRTTPSCSCKQRSTTRRVFNTGAERDTSCDNVRYDLIPTVGLRRLAETMKEGADKYGELQWMKGMPIGETLNHAIKHLYEFLSGDKSEDHLAHAVANIFFVMHYDENKEKYE